MALHRYIDSAGAQVPSVTQILGIIAKPALPGWAAKTMTEKTRAAVRALLQKHVSEIHPHEDNYQNLWESIDAMARAADEAVVPNLFDDTDAADAGTIAHAMIENVLAGNVMEFGLDHFDGAPDEVWNKAYKAVEAFDEWRDQTRFEPLASEVSLVDDELGFGGTLDYVGIFGSKKKRGALDFKTGKGVRVWPDHLPQVGAYGRLWRHGRMNDRSKPPPADLGTPIDGVFVLRLGKEHGNFGHNYFGDSVIDIAWRAFQSAHSLYRDMESLKEVVG